MKKQVSIIIASLVLLSCNKPAANTSTVASSTVVATSTNPSATPSTTPSTISTTTMPSTSTTATSQPVAVTAKLNFVNNADADNPKSTIYVDVNGKKTEVAKMTGYAATITKAEFKAKEIPTDAIDACGGWYAGGGDYFYIIKKGDKIELYKGWQDEGQEDNGFHWKKIKEF